MENYQISASICRKRLSLFRVQAPCLVFDCAVVKLCTVMLPCEWQRKRHFITSLWDNIKAHTVHILLIGKCSGAAMPTCAPSQKANIIISFCMSSVFERWKLPTKNSVSAIFGLQLNLFAQGMGREKSECEKKATTKNRAGHKSHAPCAKQAKRIEKEIIFNVNNNLHLQEERTFWIERIINLLNPEAQTWQKKNELNSNEIETHSCNVLKLMRVFVSLCFASCRAEFFCQFVCASFEVFPFFHELVIWYHVDVRQPRKNECLFRRTVPLPSLGEIRAPLLLSFPLNRSM